MEIWKDIPGFEGRYQVSDDGVVIGLKGPIKAQRINSGYLVVHLYSQGTREVRTVHRLVAVRFVDGCFPGAHVNHKDGDRLNNRADNLEWVTRSGNMRHAKVLRGEWARRCAVIGAPLAGGAEVRFDSQAAAERSLCGRNSSAIHHCLVGRKKSAYGYAWKRAS